MLALSLLTGSRYRPSEECLKLAELAVSESEGSPNLSESAHIRFVLGFVHLWRGNFEDAIEQMKSRFRFNPTNWRRCDPDAVPDLSCSRLSLLWKCRECPKQC